MIIAAMLLRTETIGSALGRRARALQLDLPPIPCRSPDTRDKAAEEEEETNRKKCTPITTKSELKSMVLSRFRMEK